MGSGREESFWFLVSRKPNNKSKDVERIARMKSRLRKGEIAEALFVAKALSLGMNVSKPFGQNCRYDFMVEVMGRVSRVQVKSTWMERRDCQDRRNRRDWKDPEHQGCDRGPSTRPRSAASLRMTGKAGPSRRKPFGMTKQYVVRAGGTTTRGARRYRASEVDYIAAYVGPEDEWYVIPVGRVPSAFTIVLPGQYARYREAWDLLCPRSIKIAEIKACADPNCAEMAAITG